MRSRLDRLMAVLLLAAGLSGCKPSLLAGDDWRHYRNRFITPDGRVIDTGNGGVSHSEGQGYGLLLAAAMADRATFERLWQWTQTHLQQRGDHLFIWRRRPGMALAQEDPNNASDGDLLIAWALLKAARKWQREDLKSAAMAILADVKSKLIKQWRGLPVLIPGEAGFEHQGILTVNLSYWVFPALQTFAEQDKAPIWQELIESGLQLLDQSGFGRWNLPPDWLDLKDRPTLPDQQPPRFGYNAVRIPLYLIWGGYQSPERLRPYLQFWSHVRNFQPAWTDLESNCLDSYDAPPGFKAIDDLVRFRAKRHWRFRPPSLAKDPVYYSATLNLLSRLAAVEGQS